MMQLYKALFVSALLLLCADRIQAQTAAEAMNHPVILNYYTPAELSDMEQNAPEKLAAIIYYYTQSFTVEAVQCDDCIPFDPAQFDVSKYEIYRKEGETFIRTFDKYGFRLTLVPVNQMTYTLPVHSPLPATAPAQK